MMGSSDDFSRSRISNKFLLLKSKNLNESLRKSCLMKSFKIKDNMDCILECSSNFLCSAATVDSAFCTIFNSKIEITESNTIYSLTSTTFVNNFNDQINKYLIHYWPFNGNYVDVISNANLFNGSNDVLVADRFGRQNASLFLKNGYLQGPPGFYFYGDFTLTAWVKLFNSGNTKRFLLLGDTVNVRIYFSLNFGGTRGVI